MFVVSKNWKLFKHPRAEEQIMVNIHVVECYPVTQRNELQDHATTQI